MSRGLYAFLGRKPAPEKVSYVHYGEDEEQETAHFLGASHPVVRGTLSAPVRTVLHDHHDPALEGAHSLHKRSFSVIDCAHFHAPELADTSNIMSEKDVADIWKVLPQSISVSTVWHLVFSCQRFGFSLNTLYRCTRALRGEPILLVVQDMAGVKFGAYVNEAFEVRDKFFGNGTTFLFTMKFPDELRSFHWSPEHESSLFVSCSRNCVRIGASKGHYGLQIDDDLHVGRSEVCETFRNEVLTHKTDFSIKNIEVWAFKPI